jgi:ribosomal-protein-alanine N-acetyltransferase
VLHPWIKVDLYILDCEKKGLVLMNINDIIINKMKKCDIEQVIIVENLSFAIPWSHQSFINELIYNKFAHYHVAKHANNVIGYSGLWKVIDEGHITNIAVHPDFRRQGIASAILRNLITFSRDNAINSLTLEVRKSNTAAQYLYKNFGFVDAGIRKAYYADTNEDAIVMWNRNLD